VPESSRTEQTYRYELLRAATAGVLESAGSTFLLLIALRWYGAGASANEPEARAVQFSSRRVCTSAAASARNSCTKPIREKNCGNVRLASRARACR